MFRFNIVSAFAAFLIGISSNYSYAKNVEKIKVTNSNFIVDTIADGLLNPYAISVDNDNLIVTVNGALLSIDQSGTTSIVTSLSPGIPSDAIVFGSEYIVVEPAQPPTPTSLLRVSPTGETTEITNIFGDPAGLAVQNSDFIVVDFNRVNNNPFIGNGRLLRISEGDSKTSIIASENLGGALEVFVDEENFWVTDFTFGRLLFVSANGDVTEIATGLGQPLDIEFDGSNFIITDFADGFNNPGNGRILQVSKSGEVKTLISDIGNPSGITIVGSDILFTDLVEGRIGRVQGLLSAESVPEPSSKISIIVLGLIGGYTMLKFKPSKRS